MKKNIKILAILCIITALFSGFIVQAASISPVKSGTISWDEDDYYKKVTINLDQGGVLFFVADVKLTDKSKESDGRNGMRAGGIYGFDSEEAYDDCDYFYCDQDTFDAVIKKGAKSCSFYFWSEELDAGIYDVEFCPLRNDSCKMTYEIYYYPSFSTSFDLPKTAKVKTDSESTIKLDSIKPKNSLPDVTVSSSNTSIADVRYDPFNHKCIVYGKKAGHCTITASLKNGGSRKCKVTVTNPLPKLEYTSYELYISEKYKAKLLYATGTVKWSTSNKKIATVNSKGVIEGKKLGKCTVTANYKGKKYKINIKVVREEPNFVADIDDYYTRDNYFTMRVRNFGSKTLTVHSDNAKACNYNYKIYDRKLKLKSKKKTIKAGKSAVLEFYVKGSNTWYDPEDFWIQYYFTYDGKKYFGRADYDRSESEYKKGKSWYYTYYDDNTDADKYMDEK